MDKEVPEHIQHRRIGRACAALPGRATGKFTDSQPAVMRVVGIEMLNKRGDCALYLKVIAAAAGVSVGTARDALNVADTIGLVTIEHLRGFYDIRIRSPDWLPALRERIEKVEEGAASGGEAMTEAKRQARSLHLPPLSAAERASDRKLSVVLVEMFGSKACAVLNAREKAND